MKRNDSLGIAVFAINALLILLSLPSCSSNYAGYSDGLQKVVPLDGVLMRRFGSRKSAFDRLRHIILEEMHPNSGENQVLEFTGLDLTAGSRASGELESVLGQISDQRSVVVEGFPATECIIILLAAVSSTNAGYDSNAWVKGFIYDKFNSCIGMRFEVGNLDKIMSLPITGAKKKLGDDWFIYVDRGYFDLTEFES